MSVRHWWDGCSRGVVSRRQVARIGGGTPITVETLTCGHEQARGATRDWNADIRICLECARNVGDAHVG